MKANLYISNSKKRFFCKIACFLILLAILDYSIGGLLRYYYFRARGGPFFGIKHAIEETNEDILIFGASKALNQYVPAVMEDILGYSCFNTGQSGQSFLYCYALQKAIWKRYKPKIVVLDIVASNFVKNESIESRIEVLLPFYNRHKEIRLRLSSISRFGKLMVLSNIYQFNSQLHRIIFYNFYKEKYYKGYRPLGIPTKLAKWERLQAPGFHTQELDERLIQTFDKFVTNCVESNITLVVVISPNVVDSSNSPKFIHKIREVLDSHNVQLWDYSHSTSFIGRPELFYNANHLNHRGAVMFSKIIAKRLKHSFRKE